MKGVAVLSIPLNKDRVEDKDDTVALNPLDPCGACMEWLKKIAEARAPRKHASDPTVDSNPRQSLIPGLFSSAPALSQVNPDFMVLTFTNTACEKVYVTPIGDYA